MHTITTPRHTCMHSSWDAHVCVSAYATYTLIRSVFKMSCLFLRPRPWQFEI